MRQSKRAKQLPSGIQVIKQGINGSMRKLRSPHSHGYAMPVVINKGTTVYRTPTGHMYTVKPL